MKVLAIWKGRFYNQIMIELAVTGVVSTGGTVITKERWLQLRRGDYYWRGSYS